LANNFAADLHTADAGSRSWNRFSSQ